MSTVTGCILTPAGWVRGRIDFDTRIRAINGDAISSPGTDDCLILPGFVDLHVHGGSGADVMDGGDAIVTLTRFHACHGTTSLLATTMSAPTAQIKEAVASVRPTMQQRPQGSACVLGVHLEGPFISADKQGAQPGPVRAGTLEELTDLQALAPIRVVTLAPEIVGHVDFIRALRAIGMVPQIGHSNGRYEDGIAALAAGAGGFTHLFNAMSELHHRQPGMVGAALAHAEYAEIIPDLVHVHPGAIHVARRAIPKLFCVTDATAGAGMPDGVYQLGSQTITKCLGGVRLANGALAGSVLTMDQAFRNLVSLGVSLEEASRRVSTYPADYIGESHRGRLQQDTFADIVVFSPELQLLSVFIEGEPQQKAR